METNDRLYSEFPPIPYEELHRQIEITYRNDQGIYRVMLFADMKLTAAWIMAQEEYMVQPESVVSIARVPQMPTLREVRYSSVTVRTRRVPAGRFCEVVAADPRNAVGDVVLFVTHDNPEDAPHQLP